MQEFFNVGDIWRHEFYPEVKVKILEIRKTQLYVLAVGGPAKGTEKLVNKSMLNGVSKKWWNETLEKRIGEV